MGYDYKKGLKKFAVNTIIVLLSGVVVVYSDDVRWGGLIVLAKLGLNFLKHQEIIKLK